jgi:hypothetical protein
MPGPMTSEGMKRVVIESPYSKKGGTGDVAKNETYARACVRDSLLRGEAPIASHLLHTQPGILNDEVPEERTRGIFAGHAWIKVADLVVVYEDLGITPGMKSAITYAERKGIKVEYRKLLGDVLREHVVKAGFKP